MCGAQQRVRLCATYLPARQHLRAGTARLVDGLKEVITSFSNTGHVRNAACPGVDLDERVLQWAVSHNAPMLGGDAEGRLCLLLSNVRPEGLHCSQLADQRSHMPTTSSNAYYVLMCT